MSKPILCVDFDGVIHSYTSGWQGADVVSDPPVEGALDWLMKATEHWDVQIYSSRTSQEGGIEAMQAWLHAAASKHVNQDFAYALLAAVKFPEQKPPAFLTIDDRAICFQGSWSVLDPKSLLDFKPWNKKPQGDFKAAICATKDGDVYVDFGILTDRISLKKTEVYRLVHALLTAAVTHELTERKNDTV